MRKARPPAIRSLGGYDLSQVAFPEGHGEPGPGSLALVDAGRGLVSRGRTGRGRTHLAIAIGIAAANAGRSVRLGTAAQLVMRLVEAKGRGTLRRALEGLESVDLPMIDGLGHVPLDVDGARLLFRVVGVGCRDWPEHGDSHEHRARPLGHRVRRRQDGLSNHRQARVHRKAGGVRRHELPNGERPDAGKEGRLLVNQDRRANAGVSKVDSGFGAGTGNPYQTMMFGGWRVLP